MMMFPLVLAAAVAAADLGPVQFLNYLMQQEKQDYWDPAEPHKKLIHEATVAGVDTTRLERRLACSSEQRAIDLRTKFKQMLESGEVSIEGKRYAISDDNKSILRQEIIGVEGLIDRQRVDCGS